MSLLLDKLSINAACTLSLTACTIFAAKHKTRSIGSLRLDIVQAVLNYAYTKSML